MTEHDKALVEQLRDEADTWDEPKHADEIDMRGKLHTAADRIEAQAAEIERLRQSQTDALKIAREDVIEVCARVADAFNATPAFDLPCSPFDRTEAIVAAIRNLKGSK
jgi:hypothetical protein